MVKKLLYGISILIVLLLLLAYGGLKVIEKPWLLEGKALAGLNLLKADQVQEVDGKLVAEYSERRIRYVPMDRIPDHLKEAFIAVEDNRFYQHGAIDPIAMARAVLVDLRTGEYTEGGSTITQQLAKNLFLSPEKTLKRKALEMVLAFQLEKKYSKNDILEMYLNQIYFDKNCYGIENASRRFFGKSVRDLNLAEAAMLAGIPKNPARYSPLRNFKEAKKRQETVLKRMVEARFITGEEAEKAAKTQITVQ